MAKVQETAKVVKAEKLSDGVYSMWLHAQGITEQAVPGQFISLYCNERDRLLPRPISLCGIDRQSGQLRIVYRVVGAGTEEFAALQPGDEIRLLGPLGNGFPMSEEIKKPVLIGGGIGIPPMLELAKSCAGDVTVVLGYRNADTFLLEEFEKEACRVVVVSEDGSIGIQGNVIDAVQAEGIHGDIIYACGPLPMLRGVKAWGLEENVPAWLSMEERMACGIGACLACVCRSVETDSHSKVKNKRVCKDGPVFLSTEIEL